MTDTPTLPEVAHKITLAYRNKPSLGHHDKLVPAYSHMVKLVFAGVLSEEDVKVIESQGEYKQIVRWMETVLTRCDVPYLDTSSGLYKKVGRR